MRRGLGAEAFFAGSPIDLHPKPQKLLDQFLSVWDTARDL
jgi:hypothetical protein